MSSDNKRDSSKGQTANYKHYYELTLFSKGAVGRFHINEDDIESFQKSYDGGKETVSFNSIENGASVFFRTRKINGYRKTALSENHSKALEDFELMLEEEEEKKKQRAREELPV